MTSTQIRQSFLDFFKSKQHTIVPSSSLMPDSPNLLFTNAGMNQFVPIFLGQTKCPYTPGRAADTQKCIRAGGKHNDLDDVGLDTYHHTFFEMLGNWSFGDYFKKEAIEWAWELVINIWKFPPQRLYATVYNPDKSKNDPSEFDQEAWNFWAEKFRSVGLDPAVHIVNGNKKDNFWMMGETGPCGPCSELHVDLTPEGNTEGKLVNKGDARCIEIWNLVFIQFNAQPVAAVCDRRGEDEGERRSQTAATIEFVPLSAQHVDTGMGFERVTSIIQGTKGLTDFKNAKISNYETDIFRPIFDALQKISGKKYTSTLPGDGRSVEGNDQIAFSRNPQLQIDIAFRVIGDHIRTLSFAITDGIEPGNTDRNYVLRRIHRRMVRYARTIDVAGDVLLKAQDELVETLARIMGEVFPEIRARKEHIKAVLRREADAFNKTLDNGIELFNKDVDARLAAVRALSNPDIAARLNEMVRGAQALGQVARNLASTDFTGRLLEVVQQAQAAAIVVRAVSTLDVGKLIGQQMAIYDAARRVAEKIRVFSSEEAFKLYDTYGFPLDLTELMARERGLTVDKEGFEKLMEEQRARARAAQKKEVISLSQIETTTPTKFVGFEKLETPARVLEVISIKDKTAVILDESVCYAEMGGQVGDTGEIVQVHAAIWPASEKPGDKVFIKNTQKSGNTWLHFVDGENIPAAGDEVVLRVNQPRRNAIQRHHTVTHLLHWALHEVASKEASQKGSFVGPDKLTFDFNSAPLTPQQVADIEKLVNERILENAGVSWTEVAHADVKNRKDVMQFFGDKYGDTVRVVQIGGEAGQLNGYSMELCGGTHTRATGEIGLFRIVGESAIAAGVRRIEAVAGLEAYRKATDEVSLIKNLAGKVNSPVHELDKKIEALLAHQKELEKSLKAAQQREAAGSAKDLLARAINVNGTPAIISRVDGDGETLQTIADALKGSFKGVIVLGGASNGSVALVASVTPEFTSKFQAGKIIQHIAPIVGGKGGGKPDNARGGGKDAGKLDEALTKVKNLLG